MTVPRPVVPPIAAPPNAVMATHTIPYRVGLLSTAYPFIEEELSSWRSVWPVMRPSVSRSTLAPQTLDRSHGLTQSFIQPVQLQLAQTARKPRLRRFCHMAHCCMQLAHCQLPKCLVSKELSAARAVTREVVHHSGIMRRVASLHNQPRS